MSEQQDMFDITSDVKSLSKRFEITENQANLLTCFMLTGGNLSRAAQMAGTARQIHYDCLGYSEGYRQAFKNVVIPALGLAAAGKLLDRAINGDLVLYKGQIVRDENGTPIRSFSDIAQIFSSKLAGLSDQVPAGRGNSGPTVIINMPEQHGPPRIECNEADE